MSMDCPVMCTNCNVVVELWDLNFHMDCSCVIWETCDHGICDNCLLDECED